MRNLFKSGNRRLNEHAENYLNGLMQAPNLKRNIERMGENVIGMKYDSSQHFISDARWDHRAVYDSLIEDCDALFDGHEDTCLFSTRLIFRKKAKNQLE